MKQLEYQRDESVLIDAISLHHFYKLLFVACGFDAANAEIIAEGIHYADLRGIDTHGCINLINIYLPFVENKQVSITISPQIISQHKACTMLDGQNTLGCIVGQNAMQNAIENAKLYGIGCAVVRNSTHAGCFGFYTKQAVDSKMIGIALTNCGEQGLLAPPGGITPLLGTNVIAAAAPTNKMPYFNLDMSAAVVSAGRIKQYANLGKNVPLGWLIDNAGQFITDPNEYLKGIARLTFLGSDQGTGGYKGFGLALLADILCGVLSNGKVGPHADSLDQNKKSEKRINQNISHFFMAINPDAFISTDLFCERLDDVLTTITKSTPQKSHESVSYPGLHEYKIMCERVKNGIPLTTALFTKIQSIADRYNIAAPICMRHQQTEIV